MSWIAVASLAALRARGWLEVEAGREAVLLVDIGGAAHAVSAVCPHHAAWLAQGRIDGETVDCPRHMGQFHIPTGRKLRGPECANLRVYPVRVEADQVWVDVSAA